MLRFLRTLFRLLFSARNSNPHPPAFSSEALRDEISSHIREIGGHRDREIQVVGPVAGSDGVVWDRENIDYVDPRSGKTELKLTVARQCSCGRFIGYNGVNLAGICQERGCESVVCSSCSSACSFCGKTFCLRHIYEIQGKKFCSIHRFIGASRAFLGV